MIAKLEHIKAIIQLPFLVIVVVPLLLLNLVSSPNWLSNFSVFEYYSLPIAILICCIGFSLFAHTLYLFNKIGNGTLAPWNPTRKMVIHGIYRYVRNPMLIAVNLILLGEVFFFKSELLLYWNIFFFILNHFYFVYKEEPGLFKRFGQEYKEYYDNVPRWIPRVKAWKLDD